MGSSSNQHTLAQLNQRWRSIIWVLDVRGDDEIEVGTGFSVSDQGHIMTCAHVVKMPNSIIQARLLDDTDFTYTAKIVHQLPRWDCALLQVSKNNCIVTGLNFGTLAPHASLNYGADIYHIGNASHFIGSFLTGKVAYQCTEGVPHCSTDDRTCEEFSVHLLRNSTTHRVMGQVWYRQNLFVGDKYVEPIEGLDFERKLDPFVPIIQINAMSCAEGCSGGPLFNDRLEIVGMIHGTNGVYSIGIHVPVMRAFLNKFHNKEERQRKRRGKKPKRGRS